MNALPNRIVAADPRQVAPVQEPMAAGEEEYVVFPLSPQQEGFWKADRQLPGNPAFNTAFRHELTGPLDAALWEQAYNELVRRHEALRATVRIADGRPMLAIVDASRLSLTARDLRALSDGEREAQMERLCVEDAQHGFDLQNGPLIRVGLIRLENERYVQTLTLHHMVCDGWSIGILMDELPVIYAALVEGRPSPLPEPEIQFGDYLAWQQERLEEPGIAAQKDYWTGKLKDYARVDVAADLPRPQGPCISSSIVARPLPAPLIARLKAFSNQQGGTLFTTSLAGLMAWLWRVTGRQDMAVGSHMAGRDRRELEKLVGPLVNCVALRARCSGDMSVRELEANVRDSLLDAMANQDLPFERVVDALKVTGQPTPEPFYSVVFVANRAFAGGSNFTSSSAGVRLRTLPSKSQGALFDLFFFMIEREDGWRLSLEYRTQLFTEKRAWQLLDGCIAALEQIGELPDAALQDLDLPSISLPAEAAADASAATDTAPSTDNQMQPALDDEPGEQEGPWAMPASYAQERLWLLSRAAPEMTAFNLPAALRITGPLDARLLETSIGHVIERHEILRTSFAEVEGALTQVIASKAAFRLAETSLEHVPASQHAECISQEIRREGDIAFDLAVGPLIRGHLFRLAPEDHLFVLTLHDIVADAQSMANFQSELWATYDALLQGRQPNLPDLELQYGDFATWQRDWVDSEAARSQLDFWQRTLASPLPVLDFPLDRPPSRGAQTGVGLEVRALPDALVAQLKRLAQTQNATMFAVTGAAFAVLLGRYARADQVLFGSPIANRTLDTEAMLGRFSGPMALRLDLSGEPTLLDVLTRARDATYEALGNAAYPFELLLDYIDARSVGDRNPLFQFYFFYQSAFLQERRTSTLRLEPIPSLGVGTTFELQLAMIERPTGVAAQLEYNPQLLDAASVRNVLAYYEFVLEALVADPSRKVADLTEPQVSPRQPTPVAPPKARPAFVAPRSDIERTLAAIWERLLRRTGIGVHDDFFELGGQSILAARLVTTIEKELGIRTSISIFAYARSIAQMAEALQSSSGSKSSLVVPMNAGHGGEPLFLVHCGGGHVLRYQNFVRAMPGEQPIYGVTSPPIDEIGDSTTIEELAGRYIAEVRKVQPAGPYRIAGYSFGGLVAYEMAAQLSERGEQIAMLAIFDTANPAYYRNLPAQVRWKMRGLHLVQVVHGYLRLLFAGDWGRIAFRVSDTWENYARRLSWKLRHLLGRVTDAPVRKNIEDYLSQFALIAGRYAPSPLAAGAVLFYADERGWEYRGNNTLGWAHLVRDGVTVRYVPGDHESLMLPPNADVLAQIFVGAARDASLVGSDRHE